MSKIDKLDAPMMVTDCKFNKKGLKKLDKMKVKIAHERKIGDKPMFTVIGKTVETTQPVLGTPLDSRITATQASYKTFTKPESTQIGGSHYTDLAIQPWDAMKSWLTADGFLGYLQGNCIKYLARCHRKNGIEDLKKAQHYLEKLIKEIEK